MSTDSAASRLQQTVIDGGYCIGCGVCASVVDSPLRMELDEEGRFQAKMDPELAGSAADVLSVCPFSETSSNEDQIASGLFPDLPQHEAIGRHLGTYVGEVVDESRRMLSSSGGMTTWVLRELMARELVDGVVHVSAGDLGDDPLFGYRISRSVAEVEAAAKTRYYPVELSDVLSEVRRSEGRYALVGPPCFIKAARLMAEQDPDIAARIVYSIALVCGHLKSARFGELIAWQAGLAPSDLGAIDFRHKLPDRPANRYGAELRSRSSEDDHSLVVPMDQVHGGNWGLGYFKYKACDFCDDVLGETADCSFGDAWLPEYVDDWRGTNVVVVRDPVIGSLLEEGASSGSLRLDAVTPDRIADSQRSGLRHRRDGLSHRLAVADRRGDWRPPKRVAAGSRALDRHDRHLFDLRVELSARSHEAFAAARAAGSYHVFTRQMAPLLRRYDALYGRGRWYRLRKRLRLKSRLRALTPPARRRQRDS